LGIAIMTKGPVAFVQTAVPVLMFAIWRAWTRKREPNRLPHGSSSRGPLTAAVIAAIVVGLPWWMYVLLTFPDAAMRLQKEMTGIGIADSPDPWYSYFFIIGYLAPWIAFVIVGLIQFLHRLIQRRHDADVLVGMLLIVPIVIMAF